MSADNAAPTGGHLGARQSHHPEADAQVDGDASLVQLHQRLVDALDEAIVAALKECPGDDRRDYRHHIQDLGVDVLGGRLVDALARLAEGVDPAADVAAAHAHRAAFHLLRRVGAGNVDGQPTTRDDVRAVLPPLLAATTAADATPTVSVRLGVGWPSRRKQQRADVLRYLSHLALGVDVVLVTTDAAATCILDDHAADVPAHVLTSLRNRRRPQAGHAADERVETVDEVLGSLSRGSRPAGILRALSAAPTDALGYDGLVDALPIDSKPYQAVSRLCDDGLAETTDAADGRTVVTLTATGVEVADVLTAEQARLRGRSSAAPSRSEASDGSDSGPSHKPPQISTDMPCCPPRWDAPPDPPDDRDGAADERPVDAAESAADADRRDRYQHGWVYPRYADSRREWVPAVESVDNGEVALVDVDLEPLLDPDRDGRQAHVSYDAGRDAIHVGAEYSNPMQFAVAVACGLTSERLLATTDWADRIGDGLHGLDISEKAVLWSAVCVGWLPSDVEDGDAVLGEWRDARDELREDSGLANNDDSAVTRSQVTRDALGLIGTVVALFDLLGVDIVLEMRVPECSRHFSATGNSDERGDLLHHLAKLSALCSRVGAFSLHRQLYEQRDSKVSDAFTPGFESLDGGCTGSMRAGLVVVGDGVEDLADDVVERVDAGPCPMRDDAPPVGAAVDVVQGAPDDRLVATARRMLRRKGLRPTRTATAALAGFCGSPWGVADAIHWGLKTESSRRDVRLDEVRTALASLDPRRLVPEVTPKTRDGLGALLAADRPISKAEIARRADISKPTWTEHSDALDALDVVRETADGWRVSLPFTDERDDVDDVADPPWWLQGASERDDRRHRNPTDVLAWLAESGYLDWDRTFDPDDPVGAAFEIVGPAGEGLPRGAVDRDVATAALDAAGVPASLVHAGCGGAAAGPPPLTARMGESTRQTSLSTASQTPPKSSRRPN